MQMEQAKSYFFIIPYYEMLVARIYPVWVSPFTVIGFSVRLRS